MSASLAGRGMRRAGRTRRMPAGVLGLVAASALAASALAAAIVLTDATDGPVPRPEPGLADRPVPQAGTRAAPGPSTSSTPLPVFARMALSRPAEPGLVKPGLVEPSLVEPGPAVLGGPAPRPSLLDVLRPGWTGEAALSPDAAWAPAMAEPGPGGRTGPIAPAFARTDGAVRANRTFLQDLYATMTAPPDIVDTPRPWALAHDPAPVASRFVKGRPVPTRSPDVEFDVNGRTSLGVYGQVTHAEKGDPLNGTALPRTYDREAGVTLQYRFNSR